MKGRISIERNRVSVVDDHNQESFPLTKHDDGHYENGQIVEYELDNEYPTHCDVFCDGDETCMICYAKNRVAVIK